jgi:hypothetical protein
MLTVPSEAIEEWPALRGQIVRRVGLAVLWKGPLLGLFFAGLLLAGAAGLSHVSEGQTLDFGWFQVRGRAGAPVFPVLGRFWTFTLLTVPVGTTFLALVGSAALLTVELAYRRRQRVPK